MSPGPPGPGSSPLADERAPEPVSPAAASLAGGLGAASSSPRFAHNSERQFAKLLDFYGVEWEYEPRTFVLEWDREAKPAQAFTPDFYLPAYDLFIEITTLNQKLVTKKNRKARRLREIYPDVRIKIFYQRDYLNLLIKYGLEEPSQAIPADDSVQPLPLPLRFDDPAADEDRRPARRRRRRPA